jgi:transposase-like protein
MGRQYSGVIDVWRRTWNEFIPFLDYPAELRRIVYTTNAIESINFQLRKVTKTRGHFPNDSATSPRNEEENQEQAPGAGKSPSTRWSSSSPDDSLCIPPRIRIVSSMLMVRGESSRPA